MQNLNVDVLDASTADLDELARLQREAFTGVKGTSALDVLTSELQSASHYRHKYHAPAGRAKIAVVREGGKLLAMNAMVPQLLRHGSGTAMGWQSCDTATHPAARGRGLFGMCLRALQQQLADGDVFFGYPNANSTPGFVKFGWSVRGVLDAYAAIWPGFVEDRRIRPLERFGPQFDEFAVRCAAPGTVRIDRSAAYLRWRYDLASSSTYSALVYDAGAGLEGYAVLRTLKMGSRRICVVLELLGHSSEVERALLRSAARWGRRMRAWPTLLFLNGWGERTWLRHGWMRAPRWMSPRPLVLMGSAVGDAGRRVFESDWRAFVGDWDVF